MSKIKPITIPIGPEPTILSRKEVDALYETLDAVRLALNSLGVDYIVTGGSLLGAVRQHSILFCDDDIDIAIIDVNDAYDRVLQYLPERLGSDYKYNPHAWEGGGQIRPKRMNNIFLDVFVLREYKTIQELTSIIGIKKNGMPQSPEYVQTILNIIQSSLDEKEEEENNDDNDADRQSMLFPLWHFATRKAIEMWPKEIYKPYELFPLTRDLKFGPLTDIQGPHTPVLLLKRAFGSDCFHVYYKSQSHKQKEKNAHHVEVMDHHISATTHPSPLVPVVANGGNWTMSEKANLLEEHYIPMQPILKSKRRYTLHCRESLFDYITIQGQKEESWIMNAAMEECQQDEFDQNTNLPTLKTTVLENGNRCMYVRSISKKHMSRPRRTVYMDGVFDMFHIGHLNAIQEATKLGDRVIIGITGQKDATGYKREPIIPQDERIQIVASISYVDAVICPCPLIVTEEFMKEHGIDLVVHGFANDNDLEKQREFFEIPMTRNQFQQIPYYNGTSTTDIIQKIQSME